MLSPNVNGDGTADLIISQHRVALCVRDVPPLHAIGPEPSLSGWTVPVHFGDKYEQRAPYLSLILVIPAGPAALTMDLSF